MEEMKFEGTIYKVDNVERKINGVFSSKTKEEPKENPKEEAKNSPVQCCWTCKHQKLSWKEEPCSSCDWVNAIVKPLTDNWEAQDD